MSLTYQQSIEKLLSLADFERKARANESPDFHIRRTEMLLEGLDNPHFKVPVVHVAGSKGKGSTCAMIAAGLTANGLKTGAFISPHLHTMTERISVNGAPVTQAEFVSLFERVWPVAAAIRSRGDSGTVSVFEFQTAMAFLHFADIRADVMVIEVGLGGRLDSTNVVRPEVTVITTIGLDHVAVLGDTIEKIAHEKAGIIKQGVPVITARQVSDALEVIRATSARISAPLVEAEQAVRTELADPNGNGPQLLELVSENHSYSIRLPLLGEHQVVNAKTAVAALEAFSATNRHLDPSLIAEGLSRTRWPGRVQLVEIGPPRLIVDGAHNHDSAIALRNTLERHFTLSPEPVLILGSTGGHDPLAVARVFADLAPRVVVTRSRHPKAVDPDDFSAALRQDKIKVTAITNSAHDALTVARSLASEGADIIAAGSLFVAAEVIEEVQGIDPEIYPDLRGTAGPVRLSLQ